MSSNGPRLILVGQLVVNGPVMALILGSIFIASIVANVWAFSPLMCAIPIIGWVMAWLWWSISVPRWRLWAMRRVEDLSRFHQAAWAAQLEWPKGHFFERTEIKPRRYNLDEHEIAIRYYLGRLVHQPDRRPPLDPRLSAGAQAGELATPDDAPRDPAHARLIASCNELLRLMGVRGLHVGFSPSIEDAIEKVISALDQVDIRLPDPAWQGGQVDLKRLLAEYLVLLKQ